MILLKRLFFTFFVFIFLVKCANTKQVQIVGVAKNAVSAISKPLLENDTLVYIPIKKSDRISFFPDSDPQKKWVDSIFNKMSLDEKIGQLFMVDAYSNKEDSRAAEVEKLIKQYKIGGLIFFKGGPVRQAKFTNRFQAISKTPLFIGNDAEWGLNMRLDSTYK